MATLNSSPDEGTPLLSMPPKSPTTSSFARLSKSILETLAISRSYRAWSPRLLLTFVLATLFWIEFGGYLMAVPGLRIYEDIICHHYYDNLHGDGNVMEDGNIDESMCKIDSIQNELSTIVAALHFLEAIPGLVTTIPYGMLMDRIGRKPIFILAMAGVVLDVMWRNMVMWFWRTLPLRLVLIGPVFTLIGGGSSVGSMAFFAITIDFTAEDKRTDIFFLAAATNLITELIAPSMAAILMAKSPWIPLILGTCVLTIGSLLILFIPETLNVPPQTTTASQPNSSPSSHGFPSSSKRQGSLLIRMRDQFSTSLRNLISSFSILDSVPLILLLGTSIIQPFTIQSVDISLRYVSNRFHFSLRYSSFLWSLRAAVQIILYLIMIPSLSYIMTNQLHVPSSKKDLYLAQASILILTIGSVLIAASPTLPLAVLGMTVFTLGTGYLPLARSLMTRLVDQRHTGRLYAAVAFVETIGKLIAGPGLAQLYIVGLRLKGAWAGLPFFGLGVICGVSGVAVWSAAWVMSRRGWEWKSDGDGAVGEAYRREEDNILQPNIEGEANRSETE
ncbi:major facilitator superfamily transporter protein [Rutstroemia sp. NJR-2017a WRK4]|nr:major facilitator superfamily transporter protein [Rutstroemia sp. NJR-2017a WRK4]